MKRFTVEVEGRCLDGATYRILARTEKEALKKAEERFEKESLHDFDTVIAEIKKNKKDKE